MSNLASILKRKVPRLNAEQKTDATENTRKRKPPTEITPEYLASLRASNTRTARRKLRLAETALREQKKHAKKAAANGNTQSHQEDEEDEDPIATEIEQQQEAAGGAYEALLASLKNSNKDFAAAYHQRQKELAGDSGESSEEDDDDDEEDSDAMLQSDEEELDSDGDDVNSQDEEQEEDSDVDDAGNAEEDKSSDEKQEEEEPIQVVTTRKKGGDILPSGNEDAHAKIDYFTAHCDRDLTDQEVAALATPSTTTATATTTAYHNLPSTPPWNAWCKAIVQLTSSIITTNTTNTENTNGVVAATTSTAAKRKKKSSDTDTNNKEESEVYVSSQIPVLYDTLSAYGVRERLITRWKEVVLTADNDNDDGNNDNGNGDKKKGKNSVGGGSKNNKNNKEQPLGEFVDEKQQALFALLSSYRDILHPARPYPTTTDESNDPEMDAILLHLLNHCTRTADKVKKNNEKLEKNAKNNTSQNGKKPSVVADVDVLPRDQGFTRPKVLILLPMRNMALKVVNRLLQLAIKETRTDSIKHKHRFLEEFGEDEEDAAALAKAATALSRKPPEHRVLFEGNMDDHFRLGIKLTRGAVRLYTDFFQSDIIVASPLALATKLSEASSGGGKGAGDACDFLSSIEILVMDRSDVLLMQNWAHVLTVVEALNQMPKEQHDTDIMRVKEWYLSGHAKHYRQTIILGSLLTPELNALLTRTCVNYAGKARILPKYDGVLSHIVPQARQLFERLPINDTASPVTDPDTRFEYFKTKIWPRIREAAHGGGQLLYIPSYFDFVRVRNYLKSEAASFLAVSEYTERSEAARSRSLFADGRKRVLVYTERAQFYHRYRIRGIKDIFFYQIPEHPQFYAEMVNLVEEAAVPGAELPTVTSVFGKFDGMRLGRVVGSKRGGTMLKTGGAGTFLFC